MSQSPVLEAEFNAAAVQEGSAYTVARDAIVARGSSALPFLELKQFATDWHTELMASILVGWIKNAAQFDACTQAVLGDLPGILPASGTWPANRRIMEVTSLGNVVTPRLFEMALKTRELGEWDQTATIFSSLVKLKDARTVVRLIGALESASLPNTPAAKAREWAASSLGELRDQRAVGPMLAVMRSPQESSELRATAAANVGDLGDPRAADPLLTILRDVKEPSLVRAAAGWSLGRLRAPGVSADLRKLAADESVDINDRVTAVGAIRELHDSASAPALLRLLRGANQDLTFQLSLVETVGDIGTPRDLPALENIERHHPVEGVREYAREARMKIEEQAAVHKDGGQ